MLSFPKNEYKKSTSKVPCANPRFAQRKQQKESDSICNLQGLPYLWLSVSLFYSGFFCTSAWQVLLSFIADFH